MRETTAARMRHNARNGKSSRTPSFQLNVPRFQNACRGIKQEDLARHLGKHQSNITYFVLNAERIKLRDFLGVCSYLGERPELFLEEEEKEVDPC